MSSVSSHEGIPSQSDQQGKHDSAVALELQRVKSPESVGSSQAAHWDENSVRENSIDSIDSVDMEKDTDRENARTTCWSPWKVVVLVIVGFLISAVRAGICIWRGELDTTHHFNYDGLRGGHVVTRRQIYSYGQHPTVNWTQTPTVTAHGNTTVSGHLTVTSTDLSTVSVTVPMSASANKTKSATVSGTAGTVTMAPSVSVGTVTSSRFFGNSTIATVAMSAHGVVTVTVVPLPVYTTESVGAVGGTASTTVSNSTVSVGTSVSTAHPNWNMTTFTFTRPTVYETTTTTTFTAPDNCTLGLSMGGTSTTDGVDGMSAGTTGSSSSISIVPIMTTASEEYTSTTTETVTPVVTVDGTTTIFATDPDVVTRTRTVANSYSLLGFTSTIETCGATETATETVTTTVVSTVYASAPSTSTSVETVSISPNSTFTYTDEATGTTSKTPCSTETAVVTPTIDTSTVTTTGAVDGATGSLPNSTISSSATPCNSTRVYTMTVTPTASSSTADIFVSTIVTTITRGPNTTALVTGTIQPYGIEPNTTSTYMTYSHIPNPLGPAAPNGVFPSGFFSTQDSQTSTATSSYGTMPTWLSSIYPAHPMDSGAASAISRRGRRSLWDWWRCTGDDKDPECSYKTCVSWTCSYYAIACMGMVAVVFA